MTENVDIIEENGENKVEEVALEEAQTENVEPERVVDFEEALEAILFAAGHPISYATLARVFEMTPAKVKDKVFEYAVKYNDCKIARGVILLTFDDACQLCTKQYYLPEIRNALGIRKSGSLSTSSMEALAIIAYNQPVTRAFVDTLRRVDSSYAMNNLIDRGLIESKGRLDAPGRPMLYGTTQDFLRCFGLKSLSELPGTTDELMEVFDKAKIAAGTDAESSDESDDSTPTTEDSDVQDNEQIAIELDEVEVAADAQPSPDEEPSADEDINTDI